MTKLIPIVALATSSLFGTALAADGASDASGEKDMEGKVDELTTMVTTLTSNLGALTTKVNTLTTNLGTLTTNVGTLTTNVSNFAGRGHQVAVVETVPISLNSTLPTRAFNVDYYLVGDSTIPGFPVETVAANGKFTGHNAGLPVGTFLFELQHPIVDEPKCQAVLSHLSGTGPAGRGGCPTLYLILGGGPVKKRFDGGFGVYTVTRTTGGRIQMSHKFPSGLTFTDSRPITSYKGAVKITKLK